MNPLVIVGAVALIGLLASMMGQEAQADTEGIRTGNGLRPMPTPPTLTPAPALTATLSIQTK